MQNRSSNPGTCWSPTGCSRASADSRRSNRDRTRRWMPASSSPARRTKTKRCRRSAPARSISCRRIGRCGSRPRSSARCASERDSGARCVRGELRLSEERYRSAYELAPEALLTFDLDGLEIVDANLAAVKLYGAASRTCAPVTSSTTARSSSPTAANRSRSRRRSCCGCAPANRSRRSSGSAQCTRRGHSGRGPSRAARRRSPAAGAPDDDRSPRAPQARGDPPAHDRARAPEPADPGSESAQERVPREHVARAAHAAQRDHRVRRAVARRQGRPASSPSITSSSATS